MSAPSAAPIPRSWLFVPANVERFVRSAVKSTADRVVLDLEDSVPADQKQAARLALSDAVARLSGQVAAAVRVNANEHLLVDDLAACAEAAIPAVVIPKADDPRTVERVHTALDQLRYQPRLSLLIESCRGLSALPRILDAAGPLDAIALGAEDLRDELELFAPTDGNSQTLLWAHAALIVAALGAGVTPIGLLGSIAGYTDLVEFAAGARAAWQMGYRGSFCIHPSQVPVINATYLPNERDVAWAREVTEAADAGVASGRGSFAVGGRMVDAPLVSRAGRILAAAARSADDENRVAPC